MRTLTMFAFSVVVMWSQPQPPPESPPVSKSNSTKSTQSEKRPNDEKEPTKSELPSLKIQECHPDKRNTEPEPNENLKVNQQLATFTGLLVLVGFLQLVALLGQAFIFRRTLIENRRLIQSSQAAAEAAQKNTEFLICGERAWVVPIDISPPAIHLTPGIGGEMSNDFAFDLINRGKTVARLTGPFKARVGLLPPHAELAETPDYGGTGANAPQAIYGRVLAPGERNGRIFMALARQVDAQTLADVENGHLLLYAYASITYYDIFERARELQFGYVYKPKMADRPAQWLPIDSLEYNKHS